MHSIFLKIVIRIANVIPSRVPFRLLFPIPFCQLFFIAAPLHAAEDYATWSYRAKLGLNTTQSGAGVSGTVRGFPLLVRLTGKEFDFSQASAHGEDIRFADAEGKPLPYQIERWDPAAAAAEIWVRLDSVRGDANDAIRMHWGKPSAADSSKGSSVFGAENGFVSAWHLGGSGPRPNAVAGGAPATPFNYTGGESVRGVIGLADSLKGGSPGGYLDLGDGYAGFGGGFTFSAWVYSSSIVWYSHILDLGNGQTADNIVLQRFDTSQTAAFDNYLGAEKSNSVHVERVLALKRWQHCAVTVKGKQLRYYLDGALAGSDTLSIPISGVLRTENFLGKSNWIGDPYFHGVIDEAELATVERDADWIRLSHANQRPDQKLVVFSRESNCASRFAAARDTSVSEGGFLRLSGTALCATSHLWAALEGPAPRILDPEADTLAILLPRVDKDTVIRYRFSADYGDSASSQDVLVRIRNDVPDPVFTLPATFAWNGKDSLVLKPEIGNLPAILASAAPVLHYRWTADGWESDAPAPDAAEAAALRDALAGDGDLTLKLCMDNGGTPVCRSTLLVLNLSTGLMGGMDGGSNGGAASTPRKAYDSMGRKTDPERAGGRATFGRMPPKQRRSGA